MAGPGPGTAAGGGSGDAWYFTREQLAASASRRCGLDADKELSYRQQAANLIQDMGQRLQVSQLCINTAIVYMHRFYAFHSFTHFHRNSMAAAALFLAAKVEEQPRKLEYVIKVAHVCLHRGESAASLDPRSEHYQEQAQDLVFNENVLLQTLGFDVAIDHPHTHVVRTCHLVKAPKDLAQTSYFMASNSLHLTTMCLQYKPTVVACFCIHLASKWSNWAIPQSNEGRHWFSYVDRSVTTELLEKLTAEFLHIFDKCPSRLKRKMKSITNSSESPHSGTPQPGTSQQVGAPFDPKKQSIADDMEKSFDREYEREKRRAAAPGGYVAAHHPTAAAPAPASAPAAPVQKMDFREYREKREREEKERRLAMQQQQQQQPRPQTQRPIPPPHAHQRTDKPHHDKHHEKPHHEKTHHEKPHHDKPHHHKPPWPHKPHHKPDQRHHRPADARPDVRPERSEVKAEIKTELKTEMKSEVKPERSEVRNELRTDRFEVRNDRPEVKTERPDVRNERNEARVDRTEVKSERTDVRPERTEPRTDRTEPRMQPSILSEPRVEPPPQRTRPPSLFSPENATAPSAAAAAPRRPPAPPQRRPPAPAHVAPKSTSQVIREMQPPAVLSPLSSPPPKVRHRTSSSSSEPELVPVVKKLEETPGYESLMRAAAARRPRPPSPRPVNGIETDPAMVSNLLKESLARPVTITPPSERPLARPPLRVPPPAPSEPARAAPPPIATVTSDTAPTSMIEATEHRHKSEKKKKKEKHKHKDRDKPRDERKKHKKDKEKKKEETAVNDAVADGLRITIPRDKLESPGLKIKIPKERLAAPPPALVRPQAPGPPSTAVPPPQLPQLSLPPPQMQWQPPPQHPSGLKIKIPKEVLETSRKRSADAPPGPPPLKQFRHNGVHKVEGAGAAHSHANRHSNK